jgi:hypothetical protein
VTSPAPSGSPSRQRVAGLALLGIGVIAGIIGLASLFLDGSGGNGQAAAPPAATEAPGTPTPEPSPAPSAPPSGQTVPTDPNTVTVPTFGPSPTPGVAAPAPAPPAGDTGTEAGGGGGAGETRGPIRVYNNSTITGLAANAAADFEAAGWEVSVVANYPFGIISTTTVYYRPGTAEQTTAEELGREFGMRVHERFEGLEDASPGVIVIVTNDYKDA